MRVGGSDVNLAMFLHVLANGDGFLDKMVKVLGKGRSQSFALQYSEYLVTSDPADLSYSMRVTQYHT